MYTVQCTVYSVQYILYLKHIRGITEIGSKESNNENAGCMKILK